MCTSARAERRRGCAEDGASAVEYGLLIAAVAGLVTIVVFALGTTVNTSFGDSCGKIKDVTTHTSSGSCP